MEKFRLFIFALKNSSRQFSGKYPVADWVKQLSASISVIGSAILIFPVSLYVIVRNIILPGSVSVITTIVRVSNSV